MAGPLVDQDKFKREMIPRENNIIPNLNSFKIDLEKVDRLYFLHHELGDDDDNYPADYIMIIRLVDYKDDDSPPLYVKFTACGVARYIFISADVDLFMKVITLFDEEDKDLIYDFLQKEDGIRIEKEFDKENDVKFQEAKKLYKLL